MKSHGEIYIRILKSRSKGKYICIFLQKYQGSTNRSIDQCFYNLTNVIMIRNISILYTESLESNTYSYYLNLRIISQHFETFRRIYC